MTCNRCRMKMNSLDDGGLLLPPKQSPAREIWLCAVCWDALEHWVTEKP